MRAKEIEKWLAKVLEHGATDMVDAQVAKHVVRMLELIEAMNQKFRPKDARNELLGYDDKHGEIHTSFMLLKARADLIERQLAKRASALSASPAEA